MLFNVMCCAVMLCPVVGAIGWSGAPIVFELVLCLAVAKPMVPHVHCFGATWWDVVGDDAKCCTVVGLDRHWRLLVSHFFQ